MNRLAHHEGICNFSQKTKYYRLHREKTAPCGIRGTLFVSFLSGNYYNKKCSTTVINLNRRSMSIL
ncbi:hypothetical protein [Anoxybacillus flavithermus]|uniref:hypothetical protein n=1 Tax=Anoxybacillus flavithermus TaxID=33934 RepID=UPI0011D03FCE|nr:hypothetical protein [Anoxybacillus flavithermus]